MSTFSKGDSVLGEHSGDFKDFLKKHRLTPSGIPCFRGTADSCSPLKSLKNTASTTATPRILEEENQASLSLRADNGGEAIHNQKADSSNDYSASAEFMDCHAIATALARNDRKNTTSKKVNSSSNAPFSVIASRCGSSGVAIHKNITPKPQTLESTFDKTAQKSQSVAFLEKVDSSMDCHAIATALARNDSKNATKQKVDKKADSRIFTQAAQSLNNSQGENAQNAFDSQVAGGRIFDEKAGLCSGEQGDKTRVSIDAASHKLPAFSQKANAQTEQRRIA